MTDAEIRTLLTTVRSIAVVGWSPKPDRPSHRVAAFLAAQGYRVIPVNPGQAGQQVRPQHVLLPPLRQPAQEGQRRRHDTAW